MKIKRNEQSIPELPDPPPEGEAQPLRSKALAQAAESNSLHDKLQREQQAPASQGGMALRFWIGPEAPMSRKTVSSLKADLASLDPKKQRAAERDFKESHRLQKAHYPGAGEVESLRTARAYPNRTDIDWDRWVDKKDGRSVGVIDGNLMKDENGRPNVAAIEHGSSQARGPRARAFFDEVIGEFESKGARLVIAEMNDPALMTKAQLAQDAKRPWARADNIEFMCGDPNDSRRPGLGFRRVDARYGQLAFAGEEPVTHLALGIKVVDPSLLNANGTLPTKVYLDGIKDYFSSFEDIRAEAAQTGRTPREVVEANETFRAIEKSVEGRDSLALLGPKGA